MQLSRTGLGLVSVAVIVAACGESNSLSPAELENVVDTTTIYALQGTAITQPSGFSIAEGVPVRTDQANLFDIAFNIDGGGQGVILPLALLGLGGTSANPGLRATTRPFNEITEAQRDDYVTEDTIVVAVGDVFYARSRVFCTSLGVPLYGKIEILAINQSERSVTFQFLIDENCGYVGLEPGIPEE